MYRVTVKLDDNNIVEDSCFSIQYLYSLIDSYAINCNLIKAEDYSYKGVGSKDDFGNCWKFIFTLRRQDWFLKYVKEWLWVYKNMGTKGKVEHIEDLVKGFLKRSD